MKQLIYNISGNFSKQAANIIANLIMVPFYFKYWGSSYYGEWLVIFSAASICNFADGGLGTSASNDAAKHSLMGEYKEAQDILAASFTFQLYLLCGLFIMTCCCCLIFPLHDWLGFTRFSKTEFQITAILMVLYVCLSVPGAIIQGVYRATEKNARGLYASALCKILITACMLSAIIAGYKAMLVASTMVLLQLASSIAMKFDSERNSKLKLRCKNVSWEELKSILPNAISFQIFPIAEGLYIQGMIFLVNKELGAASVAIFSSLRTMTRTSVQAGLCLKYSAWPEFAKYYYEKKYKQLSIIYNKTNKYNLLLAGIVLITLTFKGEWLFQLWTKLPLNENYTAMLLLAASAFMASLWAIPSGLLQSVNENKALSVFYISATVVGLIYSMLVIKHQALTAIAVGMLVSEIVMVCASICIKKSKFKGII